MNITEIEINRITEKSRPREKAFYAVMRQSGLKPNTVKQLKIKHLEKIRDPDTPIPCKIDVSREIEKNKFGRHPSFIAEEAVKYVQIYLSNRELKDKEKLTSDSLLFTLRNKPTEQVNTKEISRTFKKISHKVNKGKTCELDDLREFFKQKSKEIGRNHISFLMGNTPDTNYTPEDDKFYRRLYETVMGSLEIEIQTPNEIKKQLQKETQELKERLEGIENVIFPKHYPITDPMEWLKKFKEWIEKNPEEAKLQQEREEYWEIQREKEFKEYQRMIKENPDEIITYLQNIEEKIGVLKIILKQQRSKT